MHTFGCKTEVAINNGKFFRRYPAVTIGENTPLDKLIVDTGGESKMVRDFYTKQKEGASAEDTVPEETATNDVQLVMEHQLTQYEHLPARIGRVSAKILSDSLHVHEELIPLDVQCDILKSKKPKKTHFRFAVVSGFGANLGDCTIGITAMREVAVFLGKKFDSFSIDFLFGPGANGTNADIVGFEPWIGQVFFEGPTLQDFARYDAYFDFTGLISLPKFSEMPTMDWYLWWMGLNPALIPSEKKRNRMTIRWEAWDIVSNLLKGTAGKRVLFNPKASVPLRSFPAEVAVEFAKKLLAADTNLHLVIDQPLDVKHKRLIDLSGKIDSPAKFMALIAQIEGVITVDSFATHMVDACSLPAVSIHTTLPVEYTPYYPFLDIIEIPDAQTLAGWKKCKFNTDEEWLDAKESYISAWKKLDAKKVLKHLDAKIKQREEAKGEGKRLTFTNQSPKFEATKIHNGLHYLKYDYPSPFWQRAQTRLCDLATSVLKVGMTAVLVGAGQSALPVVLAKTLGSLGVLHIFEPRWQRRTLITNDIVAKSSLQKLHWHDAIPVAGCKRVNINDNDPFGESNPEEWGNSRRQVEVNALPIDALELSDCHALILTPPTPWNLLIDGLLNTVKKHRPFLFFAPISKNDANLVVIAFKENEYQFWAEPALEHGNLDKLILIGFPNEQKVNTAGLVRINLQ
jgi:hypothetical protein